MDFRGIKEFLADTFKYILVFVVCLLTVIYVISLQQVIGPSMSPTMKNGEVLILNKFCYHFFGIDRGDIISFSYDDTKYLIKRVIGLPGETIKYEDNKLYVDGQIFEESYLKDVKTEDFSLDEMGYETIPDDMYLVLGDNRSNSLDSREIGLISKGQIIGRVVLKIWPLNDIDTY